MSIYNFTDREHEPAPNGIRLNHVPAANRTNRVQLAAGYHQIENDFMNRNFSSNNQAENSVQLTRPTSKTALLVRQRRAMLEQLSCSICKGYLIDATTIDECMDSFCKSCIVLHFRNNNNNCPKCGIIIQSRSPFSAIKPDKVLQDIVYKLVPGLYDIEMKQRRDFYRNLYDAPPSTEDDDDNSCSSSIVVQGTSLSGEQYGIVPLPKPFYKPTDNIDLSIEPQTRGENTTIYYDNRRQSIVTCFTGSLQQRDLNNDSGSSFSSVDSQLFKTYLRCPAKFTVLQLKKFIAAKFNIFRDDTIHLLYLNESLKDEYSLIDVAYIYDWRALEHMQLFYIIERDLTKVSTKDDIPNNQSKSGKLTRSTVGMSTQTVKRVCIDPQPKYYEEKNNNVVVNNNCGRSMRPRVETQARPAVKTPQIVRTNPIIQTHSNGQERRNYSIQTNGVSAKDSDSKVNRFVTRQVASNGSATDDRTNRATALSTNDSRTLRSQAEPTKTNDSSQGSSVPKITFSLHKPNLDHINHTNRNSSSQDRDKNIAVTSQSNSRTQVVPFASKKISSTIASTTQSSIMTLASFTGSSESNLITSVSASSASVQTLVNNQGGLMHSSSTPYKQPDQSIVSQANRIPSTPQLAFRFVTQRGTTIVLPKYNQEAREVVSGSNNSEKSSQEAFPTSHQTTTGTNSSSVQIYRPQSGPNMCTSSANLNLVSFEASQSSSSHTTADDAVTARHNLKVKPVYKTFVDPTKLKSPNLKKLGFTARH
jgi:hypothetical protein